ncbi:sensor histidine kinase [Glaciibacter superstes]|uniref:sensor histidine kinase n=1 Tax=Glaciibacter superstes TaxID=501023 RepID=UPI0003B5EC29|nr:sensor histidine kinase [Glaciibacter superstes]
MTAPTVATAQNSRATDPLGDGWRRPSPTPAGYRADIWIALALAVGTAISAFLTRTAGLFDDAPVWLTALWVVCIALPLAVRRRWPEAVAVIVAVVFVVGATLGAMDTLFSNICLYLAIYTVGAWSRRRLRARWVRIIIIVGMFIWLFWSLLTTANQVNVLPDLSREGAFSPYAAYGMLQVFINLIYFGAAYLFGESGWQSARRKAALEARTRELEVERERSAAQAVALERVRIARELHDVVAHHVSVMGVQAGAARRILDRDPIAARQSLGQIEQSARSAVEELHTMLGALRSDDQPTDAAPASEGSSTRGVAQLTELAEESRSAGIPVTLSIIGQPRDVPGTIALSIYRIAQEALTNTRKHAGPGATADLRLRYESDAAELEITDDGVGPRAGSTAHVAQGISSGVGLGHQGMRERVAAVGGEIHIGARPRGGYLVRARFPLASAARPTPPEDA